MEKNVLEIFELCERLSILLGDKEAIADLKKLYDRHPEMFKDIKEVKGVIADIVNEPEIIIKNPQADNEKNLLVAKQLDDKKMGDICIKNSDGTNIIFHANKKKLSELDRLKRKIRLSVETPSAKAAPTRLDHCANELDNSSMCDKALSTTGDSILPQKKEKSNTKNKTLKSDLDLGFGF